MQENACSHEYVDQKFAPPPKFSTASRSKKIERNTVFHATNKSASTRDIRAVHLCKEHAFFLDLQLFKPALEFCELTTPQKFGFQIQKLHLKRTSINSKWLNVDLICLCVERIYFERQSTCVCFELLKSLSESILPFVSQ